MGGLVDPGKLKEDVSQLEDALDVFACPCHVTRSPLLALGHDINEVSAEPVYASRQRPQCGGQIYVPPLREQLLHSSMPGRDTLHILEGLHQRGPELHGTGRSDSVIDGIEQTAPRRPTPPLPGSTPGARLG